MPDYKEMYTYLFMEVEKAVQILINAQKTCEEKYIDFFEEKPASDQDGAKP